MTVNARAIFVFTLFAVAGNSAIHASEPHNLVLFIPEALPAIVEEGSAPTLTRLRSEGVHFANSHSGFPRLEGEELTDVAPDLRVLSLIDAASQKYSTAFVYDERASGEVKVGAELTRFLDTRLADIKQRGRPFLFVYRLIEAKTPPPPADGETRRAYKPDSRAADAALDAIQKRLTALDLASSTNIIVTGAGATIGTGPSSRSTSRSRAATRSDYFGRPRGGVNT